MKAYWKRVLSIMLAAAMMVTMIPETSVTAFAADTVYESEIESEGAAEVYREEETEDPGEQPAEEKKESSEEQTGEEENESPGEQTGEEENESPGEQTGEEENESPEEQTAEEETEVPGEQPAEEEIPVDTEEVLVETYDGAGAAAAEEDLEEEEPCYETNLGLKKGTTTIYTGQTATAATVLYSQKTTYKKATAVVKDSSGEYAKGISARVDADGKVCVTVNNSYVSPEGADEYEYAAAGKYTLEVTAEAREDTQGSSKSLAITVAQGIEEIQVPASDKIYQAQGKTVNFEITPVLNGGAKSWQPKTKKLTYAIVDAKTHEVWPDTKGVEVNNGTVTVDKSSTIADTGETFEVRVQADDYAGSTVVGYSDPIRITRDKLEELTAVCIVKATQEAEGDDAGTYTVIALSKTQVTPAALTGTKAIVLTGSTDDIAEGATLKENDPRIVPATAVSFRSSSKILTINEDGKITADDKTVKKLSITATAKDNGNNKAVLQDMEISYASAAVYGLQVADANSGEEISQNYESRTITYSGTNATALRLSIMTKKTADDDWTRASDDVYDAKLTVDNNAKIIDQSKSALGVYTILLSKQSAKVTLTYKDGAGETVKDVYTVTNKTFTAANAPKLTVSGTLYANETTRSQKISYQITDNGYTGYTEDNRYARIELNAASLYSTTQKVQDQYHSLESSLGYSVGTVRVEEDGSFVLDFKISKDENWTGITAGSYKLWITFGYYGDDSTFVPETKSQAVMLKAVAPVKVSYTPVTSVQMSATDKASVRLAGSGKNYDAATEKYTKLWNANIAGESNRFTTYFALDEDNNLTLRPAAIEQMEYLTGNDGKVHCTGYVDYSYQGVNGLTYSGTTKITVTLSADNKTVDKYTAAKTTIMKESAAEKRIATVNILAGKQDADLLAAVIVTQGTPFSLADQGVSGSKITLKYGSEIKIQRYDVTLKVLPKNSLYASEYHAKESEADKAQVVTARGIEVKASITVKDKADTTGKISVASKNKTQTFLNSQYDPATQSYWVKVPYTTVIPCDIKKIQAEDSVKDMISFAAQDDYIVIYLDKYKFQEKIDENGKYDGKKEPEKTVISAKATVKFDGSADEKITFKLTLPKEPSILEYGEAVTEIENNADKIAQAVTLAYRKNMTGLDEKGAPAELTFTGTMEELNSGEHEFLASVYDAIQNSLYDAIREYAPKESDAVISFRQITTDENGQIMVSLGADDFIRPTGPTDGSLTVTADLTDGSKTDQALTDSIKTVTFELKIPKTGEQPSDVEAALKEFVYNFKTSDYKITNQTTASEIATMAYKAILQGKPQYSTLRIRAEIDEKNSPDATQDAPGRKEGTVTVYGTKYGGEAVSVKFSFEIEKLQSIQEVKEAIYNESAPKGVLNRMTFTEETTADMVMEAAQSVITNPDLKLAWAKGKASEWGGTGSRSVDAFLNTPVSRKTYGHVKGILVVYEADTNPEDAEDNQKISFDFATGHITSQEEAYRKIKAAIGILEDGSYDTSVINELTKSNDADVIQEEFLDTAQEAVANDGYQVEMQNFRFEPATSRECGSVCFTLKVQDTIYQDEEDGEIDFGPQPTAKTTQTIAEAYADVKDALDGANKLTIPQGEEVPTEEEITAAAEAQLAAYDNGVGAVIAGSGITAEVASLIPQAPTQSVAGYAWIRVDLSKDGSEEEPQTYYLYKDLPKLPQSFAQAKAAVEALTQDSSLTVNNEDYSRRQWKQNKLLSAAQAAVDTDLYTVSVTEDLVITKSTLTAKGSATITFTIKDSSGKEEDVTLTWVIPMVVARYICSCGYSTYVKKEMSSHITEKGQLGETHSYTTDYEYANE